MRIISLLAASVFLVLLPIHASAKSGELSSGSPSEVNQGVTIGLRFLADRVAVGALPTRAHQAEFEVRAVDAGGKPVSGMNVTLPVVVSGGHGPNKDIVPRLAWTSEAAGKNKDIFGVTNAQGLAYGVFTSGEVVETIVIQIPGLPATAKIQQVWNENPNSWTPWNEGDRDGARYYSTQYTMRYQRVVTGRDGKTTQVWEPITGHDLDLELATVTIRRLNPGVGADVNDDGKLDGEQQEETLTDGDNDLTELHRFQEQMKVDPIMEVEPGTYTVACTVRSPVDKNGDELYEIVRIGPLLTDNLSYVKNN